MCIRDRDIPDTGNLYAPAPGLDNNPGRDAKLFSDTHPYIQNAYEGAKEAVRELISRETLGQGRNLKEDVRCV